MANNIVANNIVITNCPFCGGMEFVEGYQSGYAAMTGKDSILSGATLRHVICRNCGSVVHSYVDDPEQLLKHKNRRHSF